MKKIIFIAFISLLIACKPPVGDIGPQGVAGAAGAKGDNGDVGEKGTFSAIVSDWKEIIPSKWQRNGSDLSFYALFEEPKLTSNIANKGLVLGFYRTLPEDESSVILPVPDETANYSLGISAISANTFNYVWFVLDFRNLAVKNPNLEDWNIKVRYILVPPASTGRLQNVDWKNYNEVKKALNIKD
ncbi:hypothetical protein [Emticicia sp.]|uniref:hypothetical protein n=1 Tax=Emticicia sp. TaxID=1930953 RepID=UPI003750CA49